MDSKHLYGERERRRDMLRFTVAVLVFGDKDSYDRLFQKTGQDLINAIIDEIKRKAPDDRFERRRLRYRFNALVRLGEVGWPYLPGFPEYFIKLWIDSPWVEVIPALETLCDKCWNFQSSEDYSYLRIILEERMVKFPDANLQLVKNVHAWVSDREQLLPSRTQTDGDESEPQIASSETVAQVPEVAAPVVLSETVTPRPSENVSSSTLEDFCVPPFTSTEVRRIADEVKLTENGVFKLGKRKLSAIVGFYTALQQAGVLKATRHQLTEAFSHEYNVNIKTTRSVTKIGQFYFKKTSEYLIKAQAEEATM